MGCESFKVVESAGGGSVTPSFSICQINPMVSTVYFILSGNPGSPILSPMYVTLTLKVFDPDHPRY